MTELNMTLYYKHVATFIYLFLNYLLLFTVELTKFTSLDDIKSISITQNFD
jgi:hypothetical protein